MHIDAGCGHGMKLRGLVRCLAAHSAELRFAVVSARARSRHDMEPRARPTKAEQAEGSFATR